MPAVSKTCALLLSACPLLGPATAAIGQTINPSPSQHVVIGVYQQRASCWVVVPDGGTTAIKVDPAPEFASGARVQVTGYFNAGCSHMCADTAGCLLNSQIEPAPEFFDRCGQVVIGPPGPEGTTAAGRPCTLLNTGSETYWVPFGAGFQPGEFVRVRGLLYPECQLPCSQTTGCVHVDAFLTCNTGGIFCAADYDRSGAPTVQDLYDFLGDWLAMSPSTDWDLSGSVSTQDLFDFFGAWILGCG